MSLSDFIFILHDALINSPCIVFFAPADYPHNQNQHAHSFFRDFDWRSAYAFNAACFWTACLELAIFSVELKNKDGVWK